MASSDTAKPDTAGAVATIVVAVAAGVLAAIPLWRREPALGPALEQSA